jgi:hypothetical protein
MNGAVNALACDNSGNLYAGGAFTIADALLVYRIAKWNGTSWSALGSGTNGNVTVLKLTDNNLYVGGNFDSVNGVSATFITKLTNNNSNLYSVRTSVNSTYLYNTAKNNTINVNVTNDGIPYTNGLVYTPSS